jgi:UrcA family protein
MQLNKEDRMKTLSKLVVLASASFVATAIFAAPARAGLDEMETRSVMLRFDPRDLNTDGGAERLLSRVSLAANKVCDPGGSLAQLIEDSSYRTCRQHAIARAVADVDRPALTAAFDRRFADRSLRAAVVVVPAVAVRLVAVE